LDGGIEYGEHGEEDEEGSEERKEAEPEGIGASKDAQGSASRASAFALPKLKYWGMVLAFIAVLATLAYLWLIPAAMQQAQFLGSRVTGQAQLD